MMRLLCLALLLLPTPLFAQSNPRFIPFQGAAKGALYTPDSGPPPHVAILTMHRTSNVMAGLATRELSQRGFMVLAMNPRFDNNEAAVRWEEIALDVKAGVEFLRKQPGIRSIVLWGHSGGGATMTFYQNVAENGPKVCQGPNKLVQCGSELAGLPRADGVILIDAHPGNPVNSIRSLNPAVMDDDKPSPLDPSLDPFSPSNGYKPKGPSTYSPEFKARYFKAQAVRMNRLIDRALARLKDIEGRKTPYPDDDVFLVVRGDGARLMQLDPSIHHATEKPRKLLKNDGTVATQIVESVRPASPELQDQNARFQGGTRLLTLRSFLSANATRGTDSMDGIDHCSTNNSNPCHVPTISVPVLVSAMGGHYFIRDNEITFEMAGSKDKDFIVIEGATHGITPCAACEKAPGQYGNSVKNFFDYVQKWINERYHGSS
jgi:hypothetical protein